MAVTAGGVQGLATLAERSAGDVRCCLNTLQFLGRRGRAVRAADVASTCAGHKDITRGAFAVWEQLLWTRVGVSAGHTFLTVCFRKLPSDAMCLCLQD